MSRRLGDQPPLGLDLPIVGGTRQHQIVRLRIDEHVLHPFQTGKDAHFLGRLLAGGQAQLDCTFQARQGNFT